MISKNSPLVTVAMVTYNSEKYLHPAIQSVLCQSYDKLELIIGDDKSTDSTWAIIESYRSKDSRIITYQNEINLTQYPNRNRALAMAKGKYIIYIDGDDIIYPHGLEFMVRMIEAFPECGMAIMYWFRNNLIWPTIITPHQFFTAEFFHEGFIPSSLAKVLFNVKTLQGVGGFPTSDISSDIKVRYNVALLHSSVIINDNITWWRETPGQQSLKVAKTIRGNIELYNQRMEILLDKSCPFTEQEKQEAKFNLDRYMFQFGVRLFLKGKLRLFSQIFPFIKWSFRFVAKKPITRDPFAEFTPSSPYMLDFSKNPYARA
jgi:glycosyltransferase involved in cell wall biosynthesis